MTTCESTTQWLACSIEKVRINQKQGCRCLCWRSVGSGGSSQYMLAAVPLAVKMLSWMWQTVASSVCWRRMQHLARLQTSCSESQPNQFFYVLASKQTSVCVAYRQQWPRLICVCTLHKATENEQHSRTNTQDTLCFRDGSVSQNESRVVLLMNGETIKEEKHKQLKHKEPVYLQCIFSLHRNDRGKGIEAE